MGEWFIWQSLCIMQEFLKAAGDKWTKKTNCWHTAITVSTRFEVWRVICFRCLRASAVWRLEVKIANMGWTHDDFKLERRMASLRYIIATEENEEIRAWLSTTSRTKATNALSKIHSCEFWTTLIIYTIVGCSIAMASHAAASHRGKQHRFYHRVVRGHWSVTTQVPEAPIGWPSAIVPPKWIYSWNFQVLMMAMRAKASFSSKDTSFSREYVRATDFELAEQVHSHNCADRHRLRHNLQCRKNWRPSSVAYSRVVNTTQAAPR